MAEDNEVCKQVVNFCMMLCGGMRFEDFHHVVERWNSLNKATASGFWFSKAFGNWGVNLWAGKIDDCNWSFFVYALLCFRSIYPPKINMGIFGKMQKVQNQVQHQVVFSIPQWSAYDLKGIFSHYPSTKHYNCRCCWNRFDLSQWTRE